MAEYKNRISERSTSYTKNNYDRIEIRFDKSDNILPLLNEHCKNHGYTVGGNAKNKDMISRTAFIKKAIENQMAIDRGDKILIDK